MSHLSALLPHRPPFVFVDALAAHDDAGAEGVLVVRADHPLGRAPSPPSPRPASASHSPPVFPSFLLVEALAQTAAAHAGARAADRARAAGLPPPAPHQGALVRMDGFEELGTAGLGDEVRLHVTIEKTFGALRRYRAEARRGDAPLVRATLTFATEGLA